jgi:CRP-like cAMP-binding protein
MAPPTNFAMKQCDFDLREFLATIGEGRKVIPVPKKQTIFAQGNAADSVFYIQAGKVRLTPKWARKQLSAH